MEDLIGDLLRLHRFVQVIDRRFGEYTRKHPNLYSYQADESIKEFYRRFISFVRAVIIDADQLASDGWDVDRANELRAILSDMESSESRDFDGRSLDQAIAITPGIDVLRSHSVARDRE